MTFSPPGRECDLCPRLVEFRHKNREKFPDFHNAPVDSFGSINAVLLIVGLAPGLKGANRTARPFTGDYAGHLLYPTMLEFGFASGNYGATPNDGLELKNCRITNAVRCVPPENKPVGSEINTCRQFLTATIGRFENLQAIVTLGKIAHDSTIRALGGRVAAHPFGHGARSEIGGTAIFSSYHCSRYNTNTGRLTEAMFRSVFEDVARYLGP